MENLERVCALIVLATIAFLCTRHEPLGAVYRVTRRCPNLRSFMALPMLSMVIGLIVPLLRDNGNFEEADIAGRFRMLGMAGMCLIVDLSFVVSTYRLHSRITEKVQG